MIAKLGFTPEEIPDMKKQTKELIKKLRPDLILLSNYLYLNSIKTLEFETSTDEILEIIC